MPDEVAARWNKVMEARGAILRALESARSQGVIGHALDAAVWAVFGEQYAELDEPISNGDWETIAIVSNFEKTDAPMEASVVYKDETTGIIVGVSKSPHEKCPRCWKHKPEVKERSVCDRCADALEHSGR
jgi:isoleucyl-tRNA synthetase